MNFLCQTCKQGYSSNRGLSLHLTSSKICRDLWKNEDSDDGSCSSENNNEAAFVFDINNDSDYSNINKVDNNSNESVEDDSQENSSDSNDSNFEKEVRKCNYALLNQNKINMKADWGGVIDGPGDYRSGVELIKILRKAKAPLYVYDQVQSWATKSSIQYGVNFNGKRKYARRKNLLTYINRRFNMHGLKPIVKPIRLPKHGSIFNLVKHDVRQAIYSLLKDKDLNKPENLLIDLSQPVSMPSDKLSKNLGDIDTGDVYRTGLKIYVKDINKHIVVPVQFFIDKTHTDSNGRLTLEPVSFTLGIYKSSVRRTAAAWRTIGYIMNQSDMCYKDGRDKIEDYHFVLNEILKEFKTLQKENLVWEFDLPDGTKTRKELIFPILEIIGDTEGHDKLVCRKAGYGKNHVTFCRQCACPVEETDNPDYKYKYVQSKDIEDAVLYKDDEALKEYGHYNVLSAFHDCMYCDPERGLYGSVCDEHLHVNQQGNYKRSLDGLFEEKVLVKNERKRHGDELTYVNCNDRARNRKKRRVTKK
jgi:hypothetical protein